ncbi:PREDICTED: AT-rich interactive domain-containing protein 3 isoform X1 [Theobroma cacao]|uniref:AT-rich interactive domain-containing protein 3 isoform X1 n=1 Tax=Theobroma cacao TaxID=3641 RepID=A0AB32WHG0_THECC|nr:PREDICTED: AT-rich interactive domain-containing protein 3 isoform X1 [Theobroma cacao]XP_017977334.1 PREDICTED: AT-rich interactive domain-containing protein 3 isoform X1 [Theobroma cacao]
MHRMDSMISDTKENENEAELAVPGASDMNQGDHRGTPQLQEQSSSPSSVPVEANSIPSQTENTNADNNIEPHSTPPQHSLSSVPIHNDQASLKPATEIPSNVKSESSDLKAPMDATIDSPSSSNHIQIAEPTTDVKTETSSGSPPKPAANAKTETCSALPISKTNCDIDPVPTSPNEPEQLTPCPSSSDIKLVKEKGDDLKNGVNKVDLPTAPVNGNSNSELSFRFDDVHFSDGNESGTEEEQSAFMKQLEIFFKERGMEFKPPKFYGEGLNCLKLWRAVTRLGGYDKVTSCKLWRQVGESFKPPKTCTTVSWTFRGFYEKALLDYERHKTCGGELNIPIASQSEPMNVDNQAAGSGRARRDAAARAMRGWHSQRHLSNGEVSDPIIKDKNSISLQKREKQLKSLGLLKRKKPSYLDHAVKAARTKVSKAQLSVETTVVDIGPPADWVKINVQKTKDCFEVYALVPGLLREEVRVQSDPAGRLVISGEPEHPDNPWGVTPFKKVVSLPARIDPHQTSAVVTLHGQLFVRVPFEQV